MNFETTTATVNSLIHRALAKFDQDRILDSTELLQKAAHIAWLNHTGKFCSPEIESILQRISQRISRGDSKPLRKGATFKVLHVLTQAYGIGGHTRLVWRWIHNDSSRSHSVVLTQQGSSPVPEQLQKSTSSTGGNLFLLSPHKNLLELALDLRDIGRNHDFIVLHQHPFDVVPSLAWSGPIDRPPIAHLNHADHVFWIGNLVSDLNVNIRNSGQELALARRGFATSRNVVLPIPLSDDFRRSRTKSDAKIALGLSTDQPLALTIASEHKLLPINNMDFCKVHSPLFHQIKDLLLIIVGVSPQNKYWKDWRTLSSGNIRLISPQRETAAYLEAADFYLDATPLGSLTSLLEAGLAQIPCGSWRPYSAGSHEETLSCDDPAFNLFPLSFTDHARYLEHVSSCLLDPGRSSALGQALRNSIVEIHMGEKWQAALENVYRSTTALASSRPHAILDDRLGSLETFDEILLRSQGGFVAGTNSQPYVANHRDKRSLVGRLGQSLKRRKNRFKRSVSKRLSRVLLHLNESRFVSSSLAPAELRLRMLQRYLRLAELEGHSRYRETAYDLIRRCSPQALCNVTPTAFENVLQCLAAKNDYGLAHEIAEQLKRINPLLPPSEYVLPLAAALIDMNHVDAADALFSGWRNITSPLVGHQYLSGVFKVRALFPEHLERTELSGCCSFWPSSKMGNSTGSARLLPLPYDGCAYLENVVMAGFDVIVNSDGELVVYDLAAHPRYPFVAGHAGTIKGSPKNPGLAALNYHFTSTSRIPRAIHLAGRSSFNYFHWLIEYLPRLLNAIDAGADTSAVLLVPEGIPESMRRALEIINVERFPVYSVAPGTALEVDNLYVPSMHTFIVDGFAIPLSEIGAMSRRHLQFIRQRILAEVRRGSASNVFARKIYLSRGNRGRSIVNEHELESSLQKEGFVSIDTAKMSFEDQVRLFRDAEIIVGGSSAAFANLLFCENDPTVISLVASQNADFDIYSNLVQTVGNGNFSHVLGVTSKGPAEAANSHEFMHHDFTIEVKDVFDTLDIIRRKLNGAVA